MVLLRDESLTSFPYGALPFLQIHYIVECDDEDSSRYFAKCVPVTTGRFSNKRVTDVKWIGTGSFPEVLQKDSRLSEMLKEVLLGEREIRVEPVGSLVRIYGSWKHEFETHSNSAMAEIADRIAMHVKEGQRRP